MDSQMPELILEVFMLDDICHAIVAFVMALFQCHS